MKNIVTVSRVTLDGGSSRLSLYFGGHALPSILLSIPVRFIS
jgi:hypothetical protein